MDSPGNMEMETSWKESLWTPMEAMRRSQGKHIVPSHPPLLSRVRACGREQSTRRMGRNTQASISAYLLTTAIRLHRYSAAGCRLSWRNEDL